MRVMHRALVLVLFASLSLISTAAFGETRELHLTFRSTHQSMWGPGSAAPPLNTRFTILNPNTVKFDFQTSGYPGLVGPFTTVDTFFWGDVEFGIGARARAAVHLGLFADVAIPNPGSVDVDYPVIPVVTFPDANSFRAGQTVHITSSYTVPGGWKLETVSPVAEFELKGDFGLHLDLYGKACIVFCLDSTSLGVPTLPNPIADFDTGEFRIFKISTGNTFATPPELSVLIPISAAIHVPHIETTGSLDGTNHRTLHASGDDEFITLSLDLGAVAEALFRLPPLSFDTEDFGNFDAIGGVRFHYLIVGADFNTRLKAAQTFKFEPDLKVVFDFPQPLQYAVNSGPTVGPSTTAEMKVGDTLHLVTPTQKDPPIDIVPSFRLDNQFHSTTGLDLVEDIEVKAGDLGVKIPPITIIPRLCIPGFCIDFGILGEACVPEICTPRVEFDPPDFDLAGDHALYEQTFDIGRQHLGDLVSGNWQLGGFNTESVAPLSIDPENPIIAIQQRTGATRNLGSGRRLVSFAIDISNPGDVPLSDVSLETRLNDAFANAQGFTLDHLFTCGLNLNPNFDGKTTNELLAIGNTLPVQSHKRVNVYAVVSPKPDPDPYVDNSDTEGRSPINTLVEANASSSFLLGPGTPTGAGDFVLFGEHFVKLESVRDLFGHVGSNDQVEVKNGSSGIVAGDLRAGKYIKVSGEISTDYALSGGVVHVVGKGRLTLFGNVKQFQAQTAFTMTSPPWQPTTPLQGNVWVPVNGTMALSPGYYGDVTVNSGGKLNLAPGTYFISQLQAKTNSKVQFDGAVNLILGKGLEIGAEAVLSGSGSSRDAVLNALQTGALEIGAGASIRGVLIAPRSNVFFGAGSSLEGSAYGSSLTLGAGFSANYHIDCDPLIDGNCDGIPDCP